MQRLHAFVSGTVQGVGFRWSAASQARRLGLSGYTRNLSDGRVEVLAEGDTASLRQLLEWLRVGPPSAEVDRVEERWTEARGIAPGFGIA